ncbi:pyridoxamine 5'-phosphate oxidase family protein [Oscillochloris sp. ZM17-4]|uniref:pyridoxamine 5'-phosphate oxidase family protein n=1 Tax=Oscillochloris sp. ZM17-4 TaxID=2866714 RepID=UPI001C7311D4|nr:pyridoxamine 5'-phosphate oxidase family protein [Oscillochloris sp. ZM17-4]
MSEPNERALARLEVEANIWLASVRPDGRPHLVPLWFAWSGGQIYLCLQIESVKARNILQNPRVALALESGSDPLVIEGDAAVVVRPWPEPVVAGFLAKYNWLITDDATYNGLIAVRPRKWLALGG